jgi:hypothetical protein
MPAARTLPEQLLALLNGLAERRVVRFAADRALKLICGVGRASGSAAEDIARRAQQAAGGADHRVLERA